MRTVQADAVPNPEWGPEYRLIGFRIFADGTPGTAAPVERAHPAIENPPQSAEGIGPEYRTAMTFEEAIG